jgi:hypothetical protein
VNKEDSSYHFRSLRFTALSVTVALAFLLSSCFPRRVPVPPPLPAAVMTPAELLEVLDDSSAAVETLTASGNFHVSGGALKTFEATQAEASGILVVERPGKIHVQVKMFGIMVADMVSEGNEYKMRMPTRKEFLTGLSDAPTTASEKWYENMRPRHIQDALFVNALPYRSDPRIKYVIEQDSKDRRSFYVIDFLEDTGSGVLQKRQRIWIDRYDKLVSRKKIFRQDGEIEADVEYVDYQTFCGVAFPRTIMMRRPLDDYELKITLATDKIRLNEKISADKFILNPQPGDRLIQRESLKPAAP